MSPRRKYSASAAALSRKRPVRGHTTPDLKSAKETMPALNTWARRTTDGAKRRGVVAGGVGTTDGSDSDSVSATAPSWDIKL